MIALWLADKLRGAAGTFIAGALVAILIAAGVGLAWCGWTIHSLRVSLLEQENKALACDVAHKSHLLEDAQLTESRLRERDEIERRHREELAAAAAQGQEDRREDKKRIAGLESGLRTGARRVRPEICEAVAGSGRPVLPAGGADSGTSQSANPPTDGAGRIGRTLGHAAACDTDYAELMAWAFSCERAHNASGDMR